MRLEQIINRARALLRPGEAPAVWDAYVETCRHQLEANTPLAQVRFIVIDTETTGLDYNKDRIVSFAGLPVQRNTVHLREGVDWRIRSNLPSQPASIEVHGLLNKELEQGLSESRFAERLVKHVGNAVLVGYKPGFDMAIINRVIQSRMPGRLVNSVIDVSELAMRLDYPLRPRFINPEGYRLDRLCERFQVDQPARHTALGDAYATAILFFKLTSRLEQNGITTLGELTRPYS